MTPEQERTVALIAVGKAIRRGWTNHNLAGCTPMVHAIRLGWLRKDGRYKQEQRFNVTKAGRAAFAARTEAEAHEDTQT